MIPRAPNQVRRGKRFVLVPHGAPGQRATPNGLQKRQAARRSQAEQNLFRRHLQRMADDPAGRPASMLEAEFNRMAERLAQIRGPSRPPPPEPVEP